MSADVTPFGKVHSLTSCDTYRSTMGGPSPSPHTDAGHASLIVAETGWMIDGEPSHEMRWETDPQKAAFSDSPGDGSTEMCSPSRSVIAGRLTDWPNPSTISPINNGPHMQALRPAIAPSPPATRSRITNGSSVLPGVDGRSTTARRYRDVIASLTQEAPQPLTEAMRLQIRAAASMQVHVEDLTARMANGEMVAAEEMTRAANGAIRALASLTRRPPAKRRASASGVSAYLASRSPAMEAAE